MARILIWMGVAALAGVATSAWANEEPGRLLKFTARPSAKAMLAALPAGVPSTKIRLGCLAVAGRLAQCSVVKLDPVGAVAAGEAALKLVDAYRIDRRDTRGADTEGRRFTFEMELLAPGDRNADWLRKPSPATLAGVLPVKAIQNGQPGSAVIGCRVTVEGYLDRCTVVSETPEGFGFGAAALMLAPQFAMTPKIRGGKPVEGSVRIPINWSQMPPMAILSRDRVISDPTWSKTPSAAAVAAAYPAKAAAVPFGQAAVRCSLSETGKTKTCDLTSEIPPGKGFGDAAKALAKDFVVNFTPEEAPKLNNIQVDIPFRFRNPTGGEAARLTDPRWIRLLSPEGADAVYPQAARDAGVRKGVGVVDCVATDQGGLADCRVVREDPKGLGFGAAALEAAKLIRMNPWTKTGDPVEGRRLSLPITLAWEPEAPQVKPPAATPAKP